MLAERSRSNDHESAYFNFRHGLLSSQTASAGNIYHFKRPVVSISFVPQLPG